MEDELTMKEEPGFFLEDYYLVNKYKVVYLLTNGETVEGILTRFRVKQSTVPENLHSYNIRGTARRRGFSAITIEDQKVVINWYGNFYTEKALEFPDSKDRYLTIKKRISCVKL